MLARMMFVTMLVLAAMSGIGWSAESGWISDPRTGCRVTNANPQPNEAITWSGGCENGFAKGQGVLQWFENGRPAERYEGELRNGQMDGHGILNTGDGGRYEGDFRDGRANGFGEWTTSHGSISGVWTNGCFKDGDKRAWVGTDPSSCP
jgi:hypothetical protein